MAHGEQNMKFGDVARFVYSGVSDDGAERWLDSMRRQAERGEAHKVPIDERKDSDSVKQAKKAQIAAEVTARMEENERSLRAMDARLILADHIFVKDEPGAIDFRMFQARDRSKVRAKFAAAVDSGKLVCVDDGLGGAVASTSPPRKPQSAQVDDDMGDLSKMSRRALNQMAERVGVVDPSALGGKEAVIAAIAEATGSSGDGEQLEE